MNDSSHRVMLARPIVFTLGIAAAALVNPALQSGLWLLAAVAVFALANLVVFAVWRLTGGRGLSRYLPLVSPVISLLGWGVLATLTGGVESPFVAAVFFEIALAVFAMGPAGVVWVTANGIVILTLGEAIYRFSHGWQLLVLEVLFVAAIGGLAAAVAHRRRAGEVALVTQGEQLGQRLESLQRALEDERVISRVGENVARLAHGLKNAVHSLRGFVALIEPQLDRDSGTSAALAGLRAAIDDLEKLARLTLAEKPSESTPGRRSDPAASRPTGVDRDPGKIASVASVVEEARNEVALANPDVRWTLHSSVEGPGPFAAIGETTLLELLVILMRNAVEAMQGSGEAAVDYGVAGDSCRLTVRDQGPGFDPESLASIFQPGYTTKQTGSGFGLFLARRIVEDHGGRLELASGEAGGAVVTVSLPRVSLEENG